MLAGERCVVAGRQCIVWQSLTWKGGVVLCSRSARWQMNSLQILELWCNLSTQGEQISLEERAKCSFLLIIGLFSYLLPLVGVNLLLWHTLASPSVHLPTGATRSWTTPTSPWSEGMAANRICAALPPEQLCALLRQLGTGAAIQSLPEGKLSAGCRGSRAWLGAVPELASGVLTTFSPCFRHSTSLGAPPCRPSCSPWTAGCGTGQSLSCPAAP